VADLLNFTGHVSEGRRVAGAEVIYNPNQFAKFGKPDDRLVRADLARALSGVVGRAVLPDEVWLSA
jgi:hypothetical protein